MNKQDRVKVFNRILQTIIAGVSEENTVSIDFESMATDLDIHKHYVYKVVMLLTRDFSALKKLHKSKFTAFPALWQVMGSDVDIAYQAYQKNFNELKKAPPLPQLTLGEALSPAKQLFGFELQGQIAWFETKELAEIEAQKTVKQHDLPMIDLLQKVGRVVNQPTVTYF